VRALPSAFSFALVSVFPLLSIVVLVSSCALSPVSADSRRYLDYYTPRDQQRGEERMLVVSSAMNPTSSVDYWFD
jgi:hypothetical protein